MKTTIGDLFNFIKYKGIELLKEDVNVLTREGYKKILACDITLPNANTCFLELENGFHLICSKDHMVRLPNGNYKKAYDMKIGNYVTTLEGNVPIKTITKLKGKVDLFDLQVADIQEYYTNGIASHNSTILECVKIGLYGTTSKKNIADIANWKNKNGEIEINFQTRDKLVQIERKFSTTQKVSVVVNGNKNDVAAKKDLQKYIDTELLDLNYYVFSNLVSLTITDFKSFLKMSPQDKRLIIDKVFSLSVLNVMKEEFKKDLKKVVDQISTYNKEFINLESNIEKYKLELDILKKMLEKDNTEKINIIIETISNLENNYTDIQTKYDELKEKRNKTKKKNTEMLGYMSDIKSNISTKKRELSLYEQNKCGKCGSSLTTDYHIGVKNELEIELTKYNDELSELEVGRKKYSDFIDKVDDKLEYYSKEITEINSEKKKLTSDLKKLQDEIVDTESTKSISNFLEQDIKKKDVIDKEFTNINKKNKFLGIVDKILSDKGIKQMAISNIVPSLNKTINETLNDFDLSFNVEFDENFNSKIYNRGLEIKGGDPSSGEHTILDFCVLITMIKLLKTKYVDLNIIFLDEIFSNLDLDNVYTVLKILKKISNELKLNIYVMHHSILDLSIFDSIIKVEKKDGVFSTF